MIIQVNDVFDTLFYCVYALSAVVACVEVVLMAIEINPLFIAG